MIRFTCVADAHAGEHYGQCIALAAARMKDTKPGLLVMAGDMVEFSTITKFIRIKSMEKSQPQDVEEECKLLTGQVLEPLCKAVPNGCEIIFGEGNHEFRLKRYLAERASAIASLVTLDKIIDFEGLGITYIHSKGGSFVYKRGPMNFIHGKYGGVHPAKQVYEKFGGPCTVFGHTHRHSVYRYKKGNNSDEIAWGMGCLCGPPSWSDWDNYTRDFAEGWFDEETNEFGISGCNISGKGGRFDYLYTPDGEYSAKCTYDKHGGEHWTASRVADSKLRNISKKR